MQFLTAFAPIFPAGIAILPDQRKINYDNAVEAPNDHILVCLAAACDNQNVVESKEPVKPVVLASPSPAYLSPGESMASFNLPEGYKLELVANESMLNEPVAIAWDDLGSVIDIRCSCLIQASSRASLSCAKLRGREKK